MSDQAQKDLQSLGAAALAIQSAASLNEVLQAVTEKARELVGAHQATTSFIVSKDWAKAMHAVSLSDKYAAWREYDERPDGSGIYRLVCQLNRPMRMTQAELEAHPAWQGFGKAASRHPPMRGWLAVPLTGRGGRNIGLIQLSDKYEGDFTEEDEAVLLKLARLASVAIEKVRRFARVQRRAKGTSWRERMGIFPAVEVFVETHQACGDLRWVTSSPTPRGYLVRVICPCGVVFERWVLPQDAEEDLLRSRLEAYLN